MDDEFWELFGEFGKDSAGVPMPLTVEPYLRQGATGRLYADPIDHAGLPQFTKRRLVRSSDGSETLSTAQVSMPYSMREDFPVDSRVTLRDGRVTTVIGHDDGDMQGMFSFVTVNLE